MSTLTTHSKIYIAGHCGLVGASLLRHLMRNGFDNILVRTRTELDLTSRKDVWNFFNDERPEYVILAAAKVGGIAANMAEPVDFLIKLFYEFRLYWTAVIWTETRSSFLGHPGAKDFL